MQTALKLTAVVLPGHRFDEETEVITKWIHRYAIVPIIRELLLPLTEARYANADITNEAVFDEHNDRYLIMSVGWEGRTKRIHGCLVHLDIIGGKVWM